MKSLKKGGQVTQEPGGVTFIVGPDDGQTPS